MGIVRFALEIPPHFLRGGRARRVSRLGCDRNDADRHLPRDQHPGRHHRLAIYRAQHPGNGAAGHDLQPVCAVVERERHPGYRSANPQRHLGPEDLLPAGRQSRSGDRADRFRDQLHPRADAAGDSGPGRGPIQRLERSGAAGRTVFGHAQRAAALRLRHLSSAAATGADPRRHAPDPGRRQVSADHGRYRPAQAAGERTDPARRGQRGQRSEPDAALGPGQDRRHAIHRAHQRGADQNLRPQRHPGEIHQRANRVREGRRPGARRQRRAAECRAHRRPALRAAQHHQERQRVDAGSGQCGQAGPGDLAQSGAARHADQGAVRSIGVRQSLDRGTVA